MKTLQRRAKRFKGYTIGLDLHLSFIEVVVLDKHGNDAESKRIPFKKPALRELLAQWQQRGAVQVVFEACGFFAWVFDLAVQLLGRERVHAAHAAKIQMIANSVEKDDHNDAWWLAYLLYERRLPEAYVAEGDLLELRLAGRELRFYTDTRSDLVRRVRSSLAQLGEKLPKGWHTSELKRAVAKQLLETIPGVRGEALRDLYAEIESLSARIAKWTQIVSKLCLAFPEIRVLMTELPGMKTVLAGLVYGELGSPKRFRSAKAYAKATGMTPGRRKSGGKVQAVSITREGSRLERWALTRSIVACTRCTKKAAGVQVKKWVEKQVARHKPKRKVIVAAARKMAEGVWRLIAWGEVFDLKRAFPA
jgi:transposase